MASFQELEEQDGVRMPWNVWPRTRVGATKCIVPMGALYTVNKILPNMPVRQHNRTDGFLEVYVFVLIVVLVTAK